MKSKSVSFSFVHVALCMTNTASWRLTVDTKHVVGPQNQISGMVQYLEHEMNYAFEWTEHAFTADPT